jgi:hypothetical protein
MCERLRLDCRGRIILPLCCNNNEVLADIISLLAGQSAAYLSVFRATLRDELGELPVGLHGTVARGQPN